MDRKFDQYQNEIYSLVNKVYSAYCRDSYGKEKQLNRDHLLISVAGLNACFSAPSDEQWDIKVAIERAGHPSDFGLGDESIFDIADKYALPH